mmetsp:Transcript_22620/g.31529  ORF Transcript_22620/g.31529 Transcript_22620/m.31529 type:complete len:111 (-) Transcript_22620:169-501(-)|eukprot:CAMPEP_0196588118 /NCGR_PEP_ID=MMETSP1081-20130531/59636_1 /TAXON_ID=36882 /ORGANISM="Pyramimonas amylifera, Strain CCMP720" /LENGTH=110 /DNA_ID=CAMNT_0041910529 /DNA_START=61 /DNA_END=393 /DNA_ORIENTATION=+
MLLHHYFKNSCFQKLSGSGNLNSSFGLRVFSIAPTVESVKTKLMNALHTDEVEVEDTSGGCGSMYSISVESEQFRGLRTPKQHQMVAAVIEEDIKQWHGFTLKTRIPDTK